MLKFSAMTLDRCSSQRKDDAWINEQKLNAGFLILCDDKNLVCKDTYQPIIFSYEQIISVALEDSPMVFLGIQSNKPIFAIDVTGMNVNSQLVVQGEWNELRQIASNLDNDTASILMLSRGLCHWHRNNRFCGRCGQQTRPIEAGHSLVCSKCDYQTFPRTDSAVIMVVTKQFEDGIERVLLGRQKNWVKGVYSCLAGYVDQGETLEQAVRREVFEESGIIVGDVKYIASQPWLFPSSLMLGFTAIAETDQINVDEDEIESAEWFSRDEIVRFAEYGDDVDGFKLPRQDSISSFLMAQWLNKN
ncbi:NAD(+) diphosphatase [Photobacterium damselae]|uniref:NAD(+) diphosphatase n=1 Tax=Photobacterium damselae TaxID=38293 RepID=UPI0010FE2017|nr:NAD(+) diphosphatase [Photobacterium damselae]TLS80658.1 NAD(+) diphosphatase [Photobacterium damselae subsp. damselae]